MATATTTRTVFTKREEAIWRLIARTQSSPGQTQQMRRIIKRIATGFGATVWSADGNVYATRGMPPAGKPYPCIVAHTDTVHKIIPWVNYEVRRSDAGEWTAVDNRPTTNDKGESVLYYAGIGGDDKCGIWLALNALRLFPAMKVAFFRDEEIGCLGSELADAAFFADCAFVLQGDRRGNNDFVSRIGGDLASGEFARTVEPLLTRHGYKGGVWGASTDVGTLKEGGIKVSVANMSCGYFDPHRGQERVVEADLLTCQALMHDIVIEMGDRTWPHEYTKPVYAHGWANQAEWNHGVAREFDEKGLAEFGFVEDARGCWFVPAETLATWEAGFALYDAKLAGARTIADCPYCGSGRTSWKDGHWVCAPSAWLVARQPSATGCGKVLPPTRTAYEWRLQTATRLNAERERALVAAAARLAEDAAKANTAPLVTPIAAADGTPGRPDTCPFCHAAGSTLVRGSAVADWWCPECLGYANETAEARRRRQAVRIVSQMRGRGQLDRAWGTGSPIGERELRDTVFEWLTDGWSETLIVECLADNDTAGDALDGHDGHHYTPYRAAQPDGCAHCGDNQLLYDTGEEAWLCLTCRRYTVSTRKATAAGRNVRLYAD